MAAAPIFSIPPGPGFLQTWASNGSNTTSIWAPLIRASRDESDLDIRRSLTFFSKENLRTMDLVLMRYLCLASILLFSLVCVSLPPTTAEVITLTGETFTDKIKEKDTIWFVKFCVPWCKHCKSLGTLWEDFGSAMEGEDEIEIGQVDCGLEKQVCSKADIHSYPSFKVFYDGEEVAKYKGKRDIELLKSFVLDEANKLEENQLARE